jgi:hypothetical protein
MSELVRRAVDQVLEDAERQHRVDQAIRLVLRPGFTGGGADVAREHDRELDDAFGS